MTATELRKRQKDAAEWERRFIAQADAELQKWVDAWIAETISRQTNYTRPLDTNAS